MSSLLADADDPHAGLNAGRSFTSAFSGYGAITAFGFGAVEGMVGDSQHLGRSYTLSVG